MGNNPAMVAFQNGRVRCGRSRNIFRRGCTTMEWRKWLVTGRKHRRFAPGLLDNSHALRSHVRQAGQWSELVDFSGKVSPLLPLLKGWWWGSLKWTRIVSKEWQDSKSLHATRHPSHQINTQHLKSSKLTLPFQLRIWHWTEGKNGGFHFPLW